MSMKALWLAVLVLFAPLPGSAEEPGHLVADMTVKTSADGIDLEGWALDPCGEPEIRIQLDGNIVLRGEPWKPLPEVTARFPKLPNARFPGFGVRLGTEQLGEGRRHVRVVAHTAKCGAEKVLLDSMFRVPRVVRRPVNGADLLGTGAFLLLSALLGWGLSRLPSHECRFEKVPFWVLVSGVAAAVAIIMAPKFAASPLRLVPGYFSALANWDGGWYQLIARNGYDRLASRAFFPLYPALLRAGRLLPIPLPLFGACLSLVFSWIAARLFLRLSPRIDVAVLFLFSLPYAFFFSAVYTEALTLMLAAVLVVSLRAESAPGAFVAGLLASLSRAQGVFLAVLSGEHLLGRARRAALAGLAGSAVGLGGWCLYLWWRFGDPLAFRTAASWFGRARSFSLTLALDTTMEALRAGNTDAIGNVVSLAIVLAASVGLVLERRYAEGLYSALVPALSLATSSTTSVCRYALGAFPALLYLGAKLKPGRWAWTVIGLLSALKLFLAWQFGRGYFMG